MSDRFTLGARVQSFRFAFRGIATMLRTQHNARIHLAATIAVVILGLALGVDATGWLWLVLAMGAVWSAEAANTALESLADAAVPDPHPLVERAKDVAAAGVLVAAITAVAIGLIVLGPPLLAAFGLAG